MEVAKLAAPPNLEVRFVSCNESAIKRWLSSELEETVFSLTHELFMSQHHTVTLSTHSSLANQNLYLFAMLIISIVRGRVNTHHQAHITGSTTGPPRSAAIGTWTVGGGIELPCNYVMHGRPIAHFKTF